MIIQKIYEDLKSANQPVAKVLHKGQNFRVLAIGFKKEMVLKEHQAHIPSKLTVLSGRVVYVESDIKVELGLYDEKDIPVNITHSVEALDDSLCLLTQGA